MRKVLLGSIFLFGLLALIAPATASDDLPYAPTTGAIDHIITGHVARDAELFSNKDGVELPAFAVFSSHLTDNDPIDLGDLHGVGADDFTVPDCGWEVNNVTAYGNYSNPNPLGGTGPAASVNLYIVAKTGATLTSTDLAGTALYVGEGLPYTELNVVDGGDLSIAIPGGVVLPGGDYWLIVEANMELLVVGQWNWTESGTLDGGVGGGGINGDESNWVQFNTTIVDVDNAAGTPGCVDAWGARITNCDMTRPADGTPNPEHDLAFAIEGNVLAAGVAVVATTLNTTEDGSNVSYSVTLTSPPTPGATVTVTPASNDITEGTVSGALMFTGANWDIPQDVTVTPGPSGDANDGDVTYAVSNTVTTTAGGGCYDGILASDVSVTNVNIEGTQVILVDPASGLVVSEDGMVTATFTVSAGGILPTMDVTVDLTNNTPTEVSLDMASVLLTAGNAYSVDVIATGVLDNTADGDTVFSITTESSVSVDAGYMGLNPADVSGTTTDNDSATITVTPSSDPLTTSETDAPGGANTVSYVLTSIPTDDVTITIGTDDPSEATVAPTSITFTPANWNMAQSVTVTGEDDDVDDATVNYNVIVSNTNSNDGNYNGLAVDAAAATNADDTDTAGWTIGGPVTTSETGTTDTFNVALNSEPLFFVSIDFTSSDITEGLVSSDGITFGTTATVTLDSTNWDTGATITVQGQDDAIRDDGDIVYSIVSENVDTSDPAYVLIAGGSIPDVTATNTDDTDTAGLIVSPTTLSMIEGGADQTFTVRLNSEPSAASVTIPVTSGDTTEATVSPASLTFTTANWGTDQTVTVSPVSDFEIDGDITFDVTVGPASGGNYTGLTETVSVTVDNVDACGPMALDVEIDESIIAYGTDTCVFDLYKTNNSSNSDDWSYLGTFTIGGDGSVDTGVIAGADCSYVSTVTGSFVVLTPFPVATVPTLGEWGMIAMISLLAMAGIVSMRRRRLEA